jgi:hypothetical protein
MDEVPVFEIPDFARIVKLPAVPRSTGSGEAIDTEAAQREAKRRMEKHLTRLEQIPIDFIIVLL